MHDAEPEPGLLQLPADVLKRILSSLPVQDRIGSCGLVCQQLRRATAAATNALVVQSKAKTYAYLEQYGHFLTSLKVKEWGKAPAPPFPCHNLRHLDLQDGVLRLMPVRSSLTALTKLGLTNMSFGSTRDVEVLSSNMTSLQELSIVEEPLVRHDPLATSTLRVLPPFARLTCLELKAPPVTDSYLQHLNSLTALQSLSIAARPDIRWDFALLAAGGNSRHVLSPGVTPAAFKGVTSLQQLTSLELDIRAVDETMCPFFASLTALRSLQLPELEELHPIVLTVLTQLHEFSLGGLGPDLEDSDAFELLSLLPGLQQLRVLKFSSLKLFEESLVPAAAFSALTASSNLQQLVLDCADLVDGAWAHVFPSNRQLPQLTELCIEAHSEIGEETSWYTPFSKDELLGFAKCCPGMRGCTLHGVSLTLAPHLTALQQLAALT
jgi:hypothetical protein